MRVCGGELSTLNHQPSTLNPLLCTLNPQPSTLNAQIVIGIHILHEEVKHAEELLDACEIRAADGLAHRRASAVHAGGPRGGARLLLSEDADAQPSWHGWEEAEHIIHIVCPATCNQVIFLGPSKQTPGAEKVAATCNPCLNL